MDVRCDRCQTEYELDDASVAASGASVQCTTCGHTFFISSPRPAVTPPAIAPAPGGDGGPTPSWMLTTEEGKMHRFRDAQTLQKWVVERRVTRSDSVCSPGGNWRRLGDMDELRPFFDVVAQADRATATATAAAATAARGARPTRPETPRASATSRPYISPDLDDDDVLTAGDKLRAPASAPYRDLSNDELELAGLGQRHRGRNVLVGAVVLLVALAAYVGFNGTGALHLPGSARSLPPSAAAPVAPPPVAPPPATAPPPKAEPRAAASPPGAVAPPPATPAPAAAAAPPATPPHGAAIEAHPKSYDRLVADGDRAIENGQTAKAQKLYGEALRLQPNGAAAIAGSAYVLLDKQKPLAAIDTFRRALNMAPSFGPALFGLGEAYRLEGEPTKAIAAYKRYLDALPDGPYATAARREVGELGNRAPAPPPTRPAELPPPAPIAP